MKISYKTNGTFTTRSLAKWFFGKENVPTLTDLAQHEHKQTKQNLFKFWQDGAGYLTIIFG